MYTASQFVALCVTALKIALKDVIRLNAKYGRRRKMSKIKNGLKELGCALVFSIGVLAPFALHVLGWL